MANLRNIRRRLIVLEQRKWGKEFDEFCVIMWDTTNIDLCKPGAAEGQRLTYALIMEVMLQKQVSTICCVVRKEHINFGLEQQPIVTTLSNQKYKNNNNTLLNNTTIYMKTWCGLTYLIKDLKSPKRHLKLEDNKYYNQ
jgi:hypothetical protein